MSLTPQELSDAFVFESLLERYARDPLLKFRCISKAQRKLIQWISQAEVLLRSGNGGGKTWVGAAIAVALARGLKKLDGIPLPEVPVPCVGWVLTQTYRSQVDAAQKAVLYWLGNWPHKLIYVAGEGKSYVETIWIASDLCKHSADECGMKCKTCSRIAFHVAESQSGIGGRVDWVWADEPPLWETWDEFRQRGGAQRRLIRWITATPKEKRWWYWMADRDKGFIGCEDRIVNGLVEVRSTVRDNKALSKEALDDKIAMAERSPLRDAILNGDYVDLAGDCPFHIPALEAWMRKTRPPRLEIFQAIAEQHSALGGLERRGIRAQVEFYAEPDPDESYLMVGDPAMFMLVDQKTGLIAKEAPKGVFQRQRDWACLHILARRARKLAVRFIGYSGSYGLGSIAIELWKRWIGRAPVLADIDTTGGFGLATIKAMTEGGFFQFHRETYADAPGAISSGLGFNINRANRAQMTAAIQMALLEDSFLVESEEVVRSLMNVVVDQTPAGQEKWVASYGSQDHDMICLGRGLHLLDSLPALPPVRSESDRLRESLGILPRQFSRRPLTPTPRWNP